MPTSDAFLQHPDPLTAEVARGYARGGFLMDNGDGLRWYGVSRRALVPLGEALHVPRRLARVLGRFELRQDSDFAGVLTGCASRPETWISDELAGIYMHLHRSGLVHSFEAWRGNELAGGVLGLVLGGAFIGESMFTRLTGGSKAALVGLSRHLTARGFTLLDAQIQNPHLARFGTFEVSGAEYRRRLERALAQDVTYS